VDAVSTDTQADKYFLSWDDVSLRAVNLATQIREELNLPPECYKVISIYGVPRGGIFPALLLQKHLHANNILADKPEEADIFVDDIIDSGATRDRYKRDFPDIPFIALYDKTKGEVPGWLVFPWEAMCEETGPQENIVRMIEYIGEDIHREGLIETPNRVIKSWETLYGGYHVDPKSVLKMFEDDSSDEIVLLKNMEFFSTCEHHMLPFFGKAHIAYIPNGRVVGISKLARVLEVFARRLQIQERLCQQITSLLDEELKPLGSACILEAQHFCLAKGTKIQLAYLDRNIFPDGVPIETLVGKQNLPIYSYDKNTEKIVIGNASKIWRSGRKKVYKVTFEWFSKNQYKKKKMNGSIKVTEDHPFMLRHKLHNRYNNKHRKYKNGDYLTIKDGLSVGDSLMPFSCYGEEYKTLSLNNGDYVHEHRFLAENKIGRKLKTSEAVHHKNGNTLDNSLNNLIILKRGEHSKKHFEGKKNENKSHPAHNKKIRNPLTCLGCGKTFFVKYAYLEKTQKFCSQKCYLKNEGNHKIIKIEELGIEEVYDIEVNKFNNFAAEGIIVHNCMTSRGVQKQNSIMTTSSLTGVFREKDASRSELFQMIK